MKKRYITPYVSATVIETTTHLLSASDPNVTVNRGGSVNAGDVEVKSGSASSYDVWNDDWNE